MKRVCVDMVQNMFNILTHKLKRIESESSTILYEYIEIDFEMVTIYLLHPRSPLPIFFSHFFFLPFSLESYLIRDWKKKKQCAIKIRKKLAVTITRGEYNQRVRV